MKVMLLLLGYAARAVSAETLAIGDAAGWAATGRTHFQQCDFKNAARDFTKALRQQPQSANLHFWLGKSYARLAEVDGPLSAVRHARKASVSLQHAVDLDPRNREYLRELFDFYLDSPQWFSGGLAKAALLVERLEPDDPGAQAQLRQIVAVSRVEYQGVSWRLRQAIILPSGQAGRIVP